MKKALVMLALFAPALYAADLSQQLEPVSYTHLTLPTTPYV